MLLPLSTIPSDNSAWFFPESGTNAMKSTIFLVESSACVLAKLQNCHGTLSNTSIKIHLKETTEAYSSAWRNRGGNRITFSSKKKLSYSVRLSPSPRARTLRGKSIWHLNNTNKSEYEHVYQSISNKRKQDIIFTLTEWCPICNSPLLL